ncbi:MAG: FMN-binding protein [Candidatus Sumerlaeia bacterium]|nr:FMN-binding protein [Candidatus Sumerlaeia bacterium]
MKKTCRLGVLRIMVLAQIFSFSLLLVAEENAPPAGKPWLKEALAALKIPPDWFASTPVNYDTRQPWEKARLEIRRLLALEPEKRREAIKLTWLYAQKKDIGNGHELPMYLFMGGEFAWAIVEYQKFLATDAAKEDVHSRLCLAACYRHFGEYNKALEVLADALQHLPGPPWRIAREADIADAMGDLYAEMGLINYAKEQYKKAIALYPTSNQPYGRQELHRRAAKVQTKLKFLEGQSVESGRFRDGTYSGKSLGYVGDIVATVVVQNGKIADIRLQHEEKIDLDATTIIPQRILAKQSLKVDGITGATVTYQAIVDACFQALLKAAEQ